MYAELKQEFYKLGHCKLPWWIISFMILFMVVIGLGMGQQYGKLLVMTSYDSSQVIMLILIVIGSTIFSMEFQNKTILTLMFHAPNKATVYVAKFLTIFIYDLFLHAIAIIVTVFFNTVPLIAKLVSWTAIYKYNQPLVVNMFATAGVDMIASTLIISLICLTSCLINSNTVVIVINALIVFMGSNLSSNLLNSNIGPIDIIRWNPFNMLNLTTQYYNYGTYHLTSHLSNPQLLIGTLCYIAIFTFLGYFVFRRKRF
ncbi:ABC transporter permease [Lactobacillus amylovorus]|uniref:ABC transporter permease n=1 Tax=Lactobacillus amylovorus TaxID=1604 RepID=A0A9X4A9X3_LACAM|nr:ABC transporter permease [Lactobacillus amylovorus]MDB6257307.1 ABC transporter permease [Lactobacillus amylovorus]MDB6263143.1 ABC transporter permease [Lactobacillus amylovorus]MDB6266120.1 ABC transporter permease [Lactobacillus amylovorus]